MSRRGFCVAMAMCMASVGVSAGSASGATIQARGVLSGESPESVTITDANSGDSTGTVTMSSGSGTGRGRAAITASGFDIGASATHTGAGFAGGDALVEDSIGIFNVLDSAAFDGAVLKLNLHGTLSSSSATPAPSILSVSASDWIMTNGTVGGFSGGQWFFDGSGFWSDAATPNSIAGLSQNANWTFPGDTARYNAPLYIPLPGFALNAWNQVKISLVV
jgi:hypothetical protein